MGNAPPLCPPICDPAADSGDRESSSSSEYANDVAQRQKIAVYREPDQVQCRCNSNSFKMIVPTKMLHGRQGLRVLGFEYRLVADTSTNFGKTRLYHIATDTLVTPSNVRMYIPDCLFDEVARCCQDIAQDILIKEGNLERLMVRDGTGTRVAALVDRNFCHANRVSEYEESKSVGTSIEGTVRPTLLVINGRGRSSAGVFSRKQLMTSGIEAATALSTVHECRKRGMKVILLDHYSNEPQEEMARFESSLEAVFGDNDEDSWHATSRTAFDRRGPLYVIAHSASGGKLVRSLLDGNARRYLLPRIRGVVFTDSTHNIQWARGVKRVWDLLESSACIYVRSNNVRSAEIWDDRRRQAGDVAENDEYWHHRFGDTKTVWAGTPEHSLMNWVARDVIWNHFDHLLEVGVLPGK